MIRNSMSLAFPASSQPLGPSTNSQPSQAVNNNPGEYVFVSPPPQPSLTNVLRDMTHLPSGLLGLSKPKLQRSKRQSLVKEGQMVSKMYNEVASRPFPNNGLSLEQGITLSLTITYPVITTSSVLPVYSSQRVALADFNSVGVLTQVFDQYKFDQLEMWLEPYVSQTSAFSDVSSAVDLDDANVPTMGSQVIDKMGALTGYGAPGRYHKWKPHMAIAVYSGAFTSFANAPAGWIDSASTGVQHYGLKMFFGTTLTAIQYRLTCRATVSFRAPVIQ